LVWRLFEKQLHNRRAKSAADESRCLRPFQLMPLAGIDAGWLAQVAARLFRNRSVHARSRELRRDSLLQERRRLVALAGIEPARP
jgi:hypothetical protein